MKKAFAMFVALVLLCCGFALADDHLTAYQTVLETLMLDGVWFDGLDTGFGQGYGEMDENGFAILDIDGDGREELLVRFVTAPTAGQVEYVLEFNEEDVDVYIQLAAFPPCEYYSNGIVKEYVSHNQGLSGERFWPYTLLKYDAAQDVYELLATIDAWDGTQWPEGFGSRSTFPTELDLDGDGMIYYVFEQEEETALDGPELEGYLDGLLEGAQELKVELLPLTEENVNAIVK